MVRLKTHLKDSYGMILAVGPTGSGKSTTLFSLLSQFNPEEKNISTLEDPVEYRIK
jgi:type II secretory ATPase GspE/PulE/Tfp pilus assembly ATPase PilB-like protein